MREVSDVKTTFSMLLEKTEELLGAKALLSREGLELDTQRISDYKRGSRLDDNCLFTTDTTRLVSLRPELWPRQLFCTAGAGVPDITGFSGNIAVFPPRVSKLRLAEAASCAGAFYGEWKQALMQMVYEGRSLDEVLRFAHEYFKNPMLVYDSSLKVLAYTSDEEVDEEMWNRTVANRAVTNLDAAEAIELRKYIALADRHDRPFRHIAPSLARPFYSCNIVLQKKRVGMVDIMEKNHPLSKAERDMLENLCYMLSFELLKRSATVENIGSTYLLLLTDLLNGGIARRETLDSRLAAVNWDIYEHFRVLTFVPVNTYMTEREFRSVFESMMNMNLCGKGLIYDGGIVFIISSRLPAVLSQGDWDALERFCSQSGLRCGISDVYGDILRTHYMYPSTKLALNYSSETLAFFGDVRFVNVLDHCSSYPRPDELIHPAVKQLSALDSEGQTEYLPTLRAYFACGANQLSAAKELCIHRTTMAYRLQKICELTGADLDDSQAMLHIQFSLELFDYMERL